IGIARRHPCVPVLGVGDNVGEAAGADGEDLSGLVARVAERVGSGTSLGAEDEVAWSQLLLAVLVSEHGTTADHEKHLLGSEVHIHPHARRVRGQFVQRRPHPGVVRPPEDSMPGALFVVVSVPCVVEQVLTSHVVYLQVVAVARSVGDRVERGRSAGPITRGDRRVDRYLVARSTAGSYAFTTPSVSRPQTGAPWKAGQWPCRTRD